MKSRYHALESEMLLAGIRSARQEEKRVLADLLHYLLEIDRRRVYLDWGFGSLFAFLTDGLGYEKASAYRRLTAARAMQNMPEIETKLTEGSLSLSTLCQVQQVIRHEEKSREVPLAEKRELIALIENKSQSQAERALVEAKPVAMQAIRDTQAHKDRPISQGKHELRLVIPEALHAKWQKLQDLRSQADPDRSPEALLDWLLELGLDKADPERREQRREKRTERVGSAAEPALSGPLTQATKDHVYRRDGYRCDYVSPITGRRCDTRHSLEIDHLTPVALGGTNSPENLRVLCDAHNRRRAKLTAC